MIRFPSKHRQQEPTESFRDSTNVVLCGFKGGGVFTLSLILLTVLDRVPNTYTDYTISIRRKLRLLTPPIASLFAASACSGRVVPENSRMALVI